MKLRIVIALLFCSYLNNSYASISFLDIIEKEEFTNYNLAYYKVKEPVSIKDIQFKKFNPFPESKSFGVHRGTYWVKLTFNYTKTKNNFIAFLPTHHIDLIEVYQFKNNQLNYITSTGNSILENELPINFKFPAFNIKNNIDQNNTYYLKVHFPKEANFPLKIINEKKFLNYILTKKTINSIYYGTCIVIILLNIFFFIKFKEKKYLYYFLLLISLMIIYLLFDGSLINIFRGNPFYYKIEYIVHIFTELWLLLFTINFLNLDKLIPKTSKRFFIFPFLALCFYLLFFITDNYIYVAIGDIIGISIFPILWVYGIISINKMPFSIFYVLGYFLIVPFSIFFIIGYPFGFWEVHGDMLIVKIASWLDLLVFTYAIGYSVKTNLEESNKSIEQLESYIKNSQKEQNINTNNLYLFLLKDNHVITQPLTIRETDILNLLVNGFKNKEISEKLFISENTVKSHIRNIYNKAEVKNRIELKNKILNINN